jgi:5-methylcytosine-specific restriction protein B
MWDTNLIHEALIDLGYTPTSMKAQPTYALEHSIGDGRYIYVKRYKDKPHQTEPLVLPPDTLQSRDKIDAVSGVQVRWDKPRKSTSYRHYPKFNNIIQYGYPANVSSREGLAQVMEIITGMARAEFNNPRPGKSMPNSFMELNQIFYGPPGTGKTYKTTEEAVRLADPARYTTIMGTSTDAAERRQQLKAAYDELVTAGRIQFVTFHQNFSYEDFVIGVKATPDEKKGLAYGVEDGVFKKLADRADAQSLRRGLITESFDISGRRVWKMSLGDTASDDEETFLDCINGSYIALGWGGDIDFSNCSSHGQVKAKFAEFERLEGTPYRAWAVNAFKNTVKKKDIVIISEGNLKFRAIGEVTGEYEFSQDAASEFRQRRAVQWLQVFDPSLPYEALFTKRLHQKSIYELKQPTLKMEELTHFLTGDKNGANDDRRYVLIIDEINRGNISRIFGELITLLEPDKRKGAADARTVTLPNSPKPFGVPSNLYVIGTMNTADKSLAQLDLALRRRFLFKEVLPEPELLRGIVVHGVDIGEMLQTINDRIEWLLDRDHLIGHSYFFSLREDDGNKEAHLARIFESKIIPLLQEYFFSDWERIRWVLNDVGKAAPRHQFVQMLKDVTGRPAPFGADPRKDLPEDRRYRINREALHSPEAYQGIMS